MNLDDPEDRVVAAGEYVLGTLDASLRAQLEARLATDAALSEEVYRWQDRLLPLSSRAGQAQPDARTWDAIESRLRPPAATPAAPPVAASTRPPAANDALWQRLRRWQFTAGIGIAASVLLAALLVFRPAAPVERYITLLQAPDTQRTGWIVEAAAGDTIRLVAVGPQASVPAGKTLQFWTKPQGAADPTSLGLVTSAGPIQVPAARSPAIGEQQLFELTL
ncbi:MAG: anti-sigma factor, partial [Gammaproteobacteria bacterium]|nr:anti-sigma factor [Gammaproteobacteria bacterium]